jgi:hypothetical protein
MEYNIDIYTPAKLRILVKVIGDKTDKIIKLHNDIKMSLGAG